ncbi:DUF4116 domain-containing protein [Variovorax sp. RA8]|uniref:DUF4116 domain-containing protein n=1 Tax=Variovorax sp. (strain JCM 16519 / RA8) TaxID=662548 RepID=UPI000A804A1E|nr:DUF4116 domain-containing protein [Variovorax sp. RA8]VTU34715.1 hypothetical protein RA8CHR_05030 [Variovorax sp. RA8]
MQIKRIEALRVIHSREIPEEFELSPELTNDERFMLLAIGMNSYCITWLGEELYKNREFLQLVLVAYEEQYRENRIYSNDELDDDLFPSSTLGTPTPYFASLIYKSLPDDFKADPDIMGELIERQLKVTELHETLSSNFDFLIKAIKFSPELFHLADISLQNDVEFVRLAVKTNPTVWPTLSDEVKSDPDMQEALGDIKTYISNDIPLEDLDELDRYCKLLPDEIRNDKEFAEHFLTKNYYFLSYMGDSLKDDLEVAREAYRCVEGFYTISEEVFSDNLSPRIKSLLEKSNLEPVETLTNAIESEKLHGKLGVNLKPKDEPKLTPRQRKQQSGPVL